MSRHSLRETLSMPVGYQCKLNSRCGKRDTSSTTGHKQQRQPKAVMVGRTARAVMLAKVARIELLSAKICASAASRIALPSWSPPVCSRT